MSRRPKTPTGSVLTTILSFLTGFLAYLLTMLPQKSKQELRVDRKQSKALAEYRLIQDSPKRIKLEVPQDRLDPDQYKALKKELSDRKRILINLPRFRLSSEEASLVTDYTSRTPLLLSDIEHLITYAYGGNELVPPPSRWCTLQKPNRLTSVVLLVINGIGLSEFQSQEHNFPHMLTIFGAPPPNHAIVEVLSPNYYGTSISSEVNSWSVLGSSRTGLPQSSFSSIFPVTGTNPPSETYTRTSLVLSVGTLIQESYPLPIPANNASRTDYTPTASSYTPLSDTSPMYAIDCEMCVTSTDPQALTRIAIVNESHETVYSSLVLPPDPITNYLTPWSGITPSLMSTVTTTLPQVQEVVKTLVANHPNCILIGQSLNCDLKALKMTHPYVIDTSVIFNLTGIPGRKNKLKDLALNLLDEEIQADKSGHCPLQDALAAMKLVQLKLSKDITFGNESVSPSTAVLSDPALRSLASNQNKLTKNIQVISTEETSTTSLPILKRIRTTTSKQTTDTIRLTHSEAHLTVGFYTVSDTKSSPDQIAHTCAKIDKRVKKIHDSLFQNSMFVVVFNCTSSKKNNAVAFIRVKS